MMVIFDIAEINRSIRDQLRHKLEELGFGMLQKSVWISPYHFEEDMREMLTNQQLETEVFVFSGRKLLAGDLKEMAEKTWQLSEVNERYQSLLHRIKKAEKLKFLRGRKKTIGKIYEEYINTLAKDPLLPEKLLPNNWCRPKLVKTLNKLLKTQLDTLFSYNKIYTIVRK